jgi:hypothetical protein
LFSIRIATVNTRVLLSAVCLVLPAATGAAQSIPRIVPGWGVDTTTSTWADVRWHGAVAEIYRAWSRYLQSDPHLQKPTPLWSASEQRQWPAYDLTAGIAYKGFGATVLDIRPARPDAVDEYVVKTLFATTSGSERDIRPVALTRVYAMRENGSWVFANALPRLTQHWQRAKVGAITYVVAPGRSLDRRRAARAAAFVDSVALNFGLPRIEALTYYMANSPEELHRIMGVDWTFGGTGRGYSMPWNRIVLNGDVAFGEENRHELAHVVLSPITAERKTHSIVVEGVATWLGGSVGRTFPELVSEYGAFLRANPTVTLDTILQGNDPDRGWSPAGAILVAMVYERDGTRALEELMLSGRSNEELRSALIRLLGLTWPDIVARWKERVVSASRSEN